MERSGLFFFALAGLITGLLFTSVVIWMLFVKDDIPFGWAGLVLLHRHYPNLWVIDLAPFFLSLFLSFVAEKNRQYLQKNPEHHLIHILADNLILAAIVIFLSLFLPGNEAVNLSIAVPITLLGILMGAVLYFFPISLSSPLARYLGGAAPTAGIALLMFGTGGVESRYFLLFLLVIIFGVAFHGMIGFAVNGLYAALGLASPILYTPFADFYIAYLFTAIPLFLLVGFVILEVFEVKRLDQEKKMEAERRVAVSTLSTTAAHEIFNRLTPLVGYVEILKKKISPDDPKYKIILQVQRHSNDIERIVQSISDLDHTNTTTLGGITIYDLNHKEKKNE